MSQRIISMGLAALVLSVFGAGSVNVAAAKTPSALLIETANVSPAPTPFSEVAPGTSLNLGKNGTLTFVHYGLCKEISVAGGKVKIEAKNFKLDGGKVTKETAQPCPQQLSLAASTAVAGGVVMRGASAVPEVTPNANLLLVGQSVGQVTGVKLMDSAKQLSDLSYDAKTRKVSSTTSLKAGNYTLVLQSNGKSVAEWSFKVAESAVPGTTIVHIE